MSEQKKIVFKEDANREMKPVSDVARQWFEFNQGNIRVKHGVYSTEFSKELREYRRTAVITYEGNSGPNPQDCPHKHTKSEDIPPTCQTEGVRRSTCTDCGKFIGVSNIPTVAHNYKWTDNNDATCVKDGTRSGSCTYCHRLVVETKPGTALGHKYNYVSDNNATCTKDGTETATCPRCGDIKTRVAQGSALGHNMPNTWTVRTPATEQASGTEFRKCTRCDYEETRVIPKLEHNWVSNNDGTHTCTTVGGCGVTETCSPNTPNSVCTKCGYITSGFSLSILTESIGPLFLGVPYSIQLTTNAPEGSTIRWSRVGGTIPSGLTLNSSSGLLSGTPTSVGNFTYVIQATYGENKVETRFYTEVKHVTYVVTFNATGGNCTESSRTIIKGNSIGTLPEPTRDGYEFGGWFTAQEGGLKVDTKYNVNNDVTLYARWGQGSDIEFGEPTSTFNIKYNGDITNFSDNPYTIYHRQADGVGGTDNLVVQVGISSTDGTNNMTDKNKKIVLYLKVTNNGASGNFDIGFDADSKIGIDDKILITRILNGLKFGDTNYTITVPNQHTAWVGQYADRTKNRYANSVVGTTSNGLDSGFAFTINNVFINSGSYAILDITFERS